jgi:predicted regulator of Ras-like GTPase activity (Roadblock/LC7/MglB family)
MGLEEILSPDEAVSGNEELPEMEEAEQAGTDENDRPEPLVVAETKGEQDAKGDPGEDTVEEEKESPVQDLASSVEQDFARWQTVEKHINRLLRSLNREVQAEAIIVAVGDRPLATAGLMEAERTATLARLVAESESAAARAADFLGEPQKRFEQSLHEGSRFRLYSLNLGEGAVLAIALASNVPLGTLRYSARQTAEEIVDLLP